MPSLLDPTGAGQGDPLGIESLLGSAVSGGAAQPSDTSASIASFLAAANAMANAGAPTLGPPPTTAQAILGSLGAGRAAAIQNQVLPYVVQHAALQQQQQLLDYEQHLWQFNRQRAYDDLVKGGAGAVVPSAAAPAPDRPAAPAAAPGAAAGDIAQLPDVLALPDQTRFAAVQAMQNAGMSPAEAAQYARMLIAESGGNHIDAKTGKVIMSTAPDSHATGVAQVQPGTFADMAAAHNITGSITDLVPNVTAGANYFHDQVVANNGDLRNGTIAYSMGPTGLADFLAGKRTLPDETQAYLAKTRAPAPGSVLVADSSGRTVPQPGTPAASGGAGTPGTEPMVPDLLSPGLMVPRSVELAAQASARGSPDPMTAHSAVIKDYIEKKALMPTYRPGGAPGQQVSSQGEVSAATPGSVSLSPITPQERQSMFPQIPAWQDIVVTRDPTGRITDYKLPEMGPEPIKPISDAQAQKPVEEGGAGGSYRPMTAYGVGTRTGLVKPIQIERGAAIPPAQEGAPVTPAQLQQQQQVFQQTQELENQIVHSPVYTQWAQGAQRFDAVLASLNQRTRVGDQAAIESLAKVFDPGAVVTEGKLQMAASYGGVAQQLQNALGKITGESGLPDDVRQQIVNLATAEMKTRDAAVLGQIARSRASAQAKGLNADKVLPLFQTTALTKADSEARNAPKGVQLAPPVTLQDGQFVRGEPSQGSGANLLPVPSAAQFAAMSGAGLNAIITDGQAHPERYSPAYRAALGAELQRRGAGR